MSLIAVAMSQLHCYEDANDFTTCLHECAHYGRAAAADQGGEGGQFLLSVLPAFLPLQPLLFPLVSASAQPLSGHGDAVTLSGTGLKCQLDHYTYCERPYTY